MYFIEIYFYIITLKLFIVINIVIYLGYLRNKLASILDLTTSTPMHRNNRTVFMSGLFPQLEVKQWDS